MNTNSALQEYYNNSVKNNLSHQENLDGPVNDQFVQLIVTANNKPHAHAIDLGYGFGNYTCFLAKRGYFVHAVDFISPEFLEAKAKESKIEHLVEIESVDLSAFQPTRAYDIVVAKDVLHFLSRQTVEGLLKSLASRTPENGIHYLVIFTDIQRQGKNGEKITIVNEANYTLEELTKLVQNTYNAWDIEITATEYKEADRSGLPGKYYFQAQQVTIIARKQKNG